MSLEREEDRWAVWMVQARRFAQRDNHLDAVARIRTVIDAVEATLAAESDPMLRAQIEGHLIRAQELGSEMEVNLEAWRSKIGKRRQQTIDDAAEEMARPLPLRADER